MNINLHIEAETTERLHQALRKLLQGESSEPISHTPPPVAPTAPAQLAPIAPLPPPAAPPPAAPAVPVYAPTAPAAPPAAQAPSAPAVPTQAPQTYTLDQLTRAAQPLMDAGRIKDLQDLIKAFGVGSLTALPLPQYGNFATKLREMGGQI